MTYEIKPNAIMYYGMNNQHPNNIIIETTLSEEIDREIMEEAINTALRRYPYFAVKLKELGGRLVLEENNNRVRLREELSSSFSALPEKDDDFLFCFSATGETLKAELVHALTDVHGFMPFIKTILAEYYNKLNGWHNSYNGINSADSEVTTAEFAEPLSLLPDDINIEKKPETTVTAFLLPELQEDGSQIYQYTISLDNNEVKEFVKKMGGSFTSTISALFAKAITEVYEIPEDTQIVCSNIIDRKPLLGCPSSHYLSMHPASYALDKELMIRPLNEIVTAIRNDLHEKMKTDVFVLAKQMKQFIDYLASMPSIKEKQQMCQHIVNSKQINNTFTVSYVGVVDFDYLNNKVQHLHIQASPSPILIESCAHGDVFDITLLQSVKSGVYFNAFTKVLNDYGLSKA